MTDLITRDPNDTGEIPRYDSLGDDPTRNLRAERDAILAATGRLRRYEPVPASLVTGHGYDPEADTGEIVDMVDTVTFHVVDLDDKPHPKPPHLPKPPTSYAAWERVVDTDRLTILDSLTATIDGELHEVPSLRRSVPYVLPVDRAPWSGARHSVPAPKWTKWAISVGALLAIGAAVMLAVVR